MTDIMKTLPFLPERSTKPRNTGLTMVMDKGLSVNEAKDLVSVGSAYIDFVKLGFGTSLLTPGVEEKIDVYRKAGLICYLGGTLFEAYVIRGLFKDYIKLLKKLKLEMVEVSDGSYEMKQEDKLSYIRELSKDFTVISEVGSKKKDVVYTPEEWVSMMSSELEAGSIKVIAEARESGTTGIYNSDGSTNDALIDSIAEHISLDNVLWEAPVKSQQAWFIKEFGHNVNLGNIAPNEVISLEALRCGLRGDTFFQFLPEDLKY
ncbi:MAG: phosphosulfolactate synthase [Marinilabiliaceae bacterium]|jgi:phosphosulfolactate synthase|nr:phosphosulfolactate synthase [Marinilabiliaceae bacterium]